jgi:hypothetical protein
LKRCPRQVILLLLDSQHGQLRPLFQGSRDHPAANT